MTNGQFLEITEWQKKTFGQATTLSKLAHLKEEVKELEEAIKQSNVTDNDEATKEFADCFILLYGAASSFGMSWKDIGEAIDAKMEINKARKWGKPESNGVVHHVK